MKATDALSSLHDANIAYLEQALREAQAEITALKQARDQESRERRRIEHDLKTSQQRLQLVMDTLPESIFWKDQDLVYLGCNQNFVQDAGLNSPHDIVGKTDFDLPWKREEAEFYRTCDRRVMQSNQAEMGIIEPQLKGDGQQTWLETNKAPLHNVQGDIIGILGTYQDITARQQAEMALQELNETLSQQTVELTSTLEQLQQSQLQLIQQEKMSALGNLVAGIAHEINNPVGFLSGNLQPAQAYIQDLFGLLDLYQAALPSPGEVIEDEIDAINLAYLREDLPQVLRSMREGIKRIGSISTSLRTFSRADTEHRIPFKLHEGLDSTLLILEHRLKADEHRPAIQVSTHYREMPAIECFPGQLNQVFMNLLANAIDALEESNRGQSFDDIQAQPNHITVTAELSACQQWAVVKVRDNGVGMTAETQAKIFENLFTTKGVGQGTGLGLAIARQIVVEKHQGTLEVHSTLGQGSEFVMQIPAIAPELIES